MSADLLSVLYTLSEGLGAIARKRAIDRSPPKGKKLSRVEGVRAPKSVAPRQRAREFPNESLTVSNGKLFCQACREELS